MRIAAFYSDSMWTGWVQNRGFAKVLRRMGHDVVEIGIPPVDKIKRADLERINKPIDDCELAIISGPEHLRKWIKQFYPNIKCPKVGWYHESFVRGTGTQNNFLDYRINYADFEGWLDFHFFPDADDAQKYKGQFLPLGVDTKMFHSDPNDDVGYSGHPEDIPSAFIGLMYPKREEFLKKLKPLLSDIDFKVGNVVVQDLDGINIERSAEELARTYRRTKVFVCLPTMSKVLVAKVLEAMACGCYVVAPARNRSYVKNFVGYETPEDCAIQIKAGLLTTGELGRMAAREAREHHSMESRFEKIFAKVCPPKALCAS